MQYEAALALYEDIVPKSLEYYLGLVESMDGLMGDEVEDD